MPGAVRRAVLVSHSRRLEERLLRVARLKRDAGISERFKRK